MATVTGFTAARMLAMEDATIIDGNIVGDDLILLTKDGTPINAGNVRGPVGPSGYPNPTGTFIIGGWAVDPDGYWILDGRTVFDGAIDYPDLAVMYPSWISGNNLVLPNPVNTVPMVTSGAPGVVSGSMTHTLATAQLPAHTHAGPSHRHTIAHNHTLSLSVSDPGHMHPASGYELNSNDSMGKFYTLAGTSGNNYHWADPGIAYRTQWAAYATPPTSYAYANVGVTGSVGAASASTYSGYDGGGNTGSAGSGNAIDHTPKNLSVKMAVKY